MYSTPVIYLGVSLSPECGKIVQLSSGNKHFFGLSLFGLGLSLSLVGAVTWWFCLDFVVLWEIAQGCHTYIYFFDSASIL